MNQPTPKITLSMIVKNEANRYLRQALVNNRHYIDEAVIIDDGSHDHTVALCKEVLHDIPLRIICNPVSSFHQEVNLRKQQWQETLATDPDWILNFDADEWFEHNNANELRSFLQTTTSDAIYFRLYDMWDDTHYRDDFYWRAHHTYRPFLLRNIKGVDHIWRETGQHSGRFPQSITHYPYYLHPLRIKHYGWAKPADREAKYKRYMELDGEGKHGWLEQYHSILDPDPKKVLFE